MCVVPLLVWCAITSSSFTAPDAKPTLLDLAKKKFAARTLTNAEVKLFTATENGEPTSALEYHNDPAKAEGWPDSRVIHADCLGWLITDREASRTVTYNGIELRGVRVVGTLDLSDAEVSFPLFASKCAFRNIYLRRAHMRGVYLTGCYVAVLNANAANIDNGFFLRNGSTARGEVNFVNATIGNTLDFEGAELINPKAKALNASGCKIKGNVLLQHGFRAEGEVNFVGATIDGDLLCNGAELTNPKGKALNVTAGKIQADVLLQYGFSAEGEVDFGGATIGGNLECEGGCFTNLNHHGIALNANGATIRGNLYLKTDFKAEGQIDLFQASVGGSLGLDDAELMAGKGATVDLRSATVGVLLDAESGWPLKDRLLLDGFTYSRVLSDVDASKRIRWLHLQPSTNFRPQPYEQLASVLRAMGDDRVARKVMIEKNQDHANFTKRFSQEWWWYNVFGWLIGYGYRPSRAFIISLGMIALGWLLFRVGYDRNIISPTDEDGYFRDSAGQIVLKNGRYAVSENYTKFNSFVFSLESFTPLLKLDQSSNWTPNANRGVDIHFWRFHFKTGSLLRLYLWFHIMAGWILTSLWVGGITGLVKT